MDSVADSISSPSPMDLKQPKATVASRPKPDKPRVRRKSSRACVPCRKRRVRCDVVDRGSPCSSCHARGKECLEGPRPYSFQCPTGDATQSSPVHSNESNNYATPDQHSPESLSNSESESHESSHLAYPEFLPSSCGLYLSYPFLEVGNFSNLASCDIDYLELQGCFTVPRRDILDAIIQQYFLHVHPFLPMLNEGDFWDMYTRKPSHHVSDPKISLLVFQAMIFASCNFTSLDTVRAMGFASIKQAKANTYRRAKLLFDFETESSSVSLAQAALLLSYRTSPTSAGVRNSNTIWLGLAIQHAEIADAHRYASMRSDPTAEGYGSSISPTTLKRLWWCCVIRDRILPLCTRRSIQIDRNQFDFVINPPLGYEDLEDELERSKVYSPESKKSLFGLLSRLIDLCILLTDLLALTYPSNPNLPFPQSPAFYDQEIIKSKEALREWGHALCNSQPYQLIEALMNDRNLRIRPIGEEPATLYMNLLQLYYQYVALHYRRPALPIFVSFCCLATCSPLERSTSWLALCHHEALNYNNGTDITLDNTELMTGRLTSYENQQEVQNAIFGVTSCIERLSRLNLHRWLPSSAVACVAIPLVLRTLDVKLFTLNTATCPGAERSDILRRYRNFEALIEAMRTYNEQYDNVELIVNAVRCIIDHLGLDELHLITGGRPAENLGWKDVLAQPGFISKGCHNHRPGH